MIGRIIHEIMNSLSRWYDAGIVYSGTIPTKGFDLNLSRDAGIKEVLEVLRKQGLHCRIMGNTIFVGP